MKTFATLILLAAAAVFPSSCSTPEAMTYAWRGDPAGPTPELVSYQANARMTKYSYRIAAGDTCQMALERNVIFISYETAGDALILHVKVEHP
jgi:hypothetical protein